ncbi:hypothetical protein Godav_021187 [Gossypium davidsonii]|uniref:Uncharacterized protein n=1 Tax=Gossypium davidsonii TaxID=34287 RepID=A0A7J8R5D5_GOSDV|nr:hypothetical protein [Gossypium davidsonii]
MSSHTSMKRFEKKKTRPIGAKENSRKFRYETRF